MIVVVVLLVAGAAAVGVLVGRRSRPHPTAPVQATGPAPASVETPTEVVVDPAAAAVLVTDEIDRFAAPGHRVSASTPPEPTAAAAVPPARHHLEPAGADAGTEPQSAADSELEPVAAAEPGPAEPTVIEPVADAEAEAAPVPLAEAEPIAASTPAPRDEPVPSADADPETVGGDVDQVLQALITRARFTTDEVALVAAELVDRADLDASEVTAVLADLVERADAAEVIDVTDRTEELVLFADDVPSRPGRLRGYSDLDEEEKRRVIIRVLCLLVAQSAEAGDDAAAPEGADEGQPARSGGFPLTRAIWPSRSGSEKSLPARRLARTRR